MNVATWKRTQAKNLKRRKAVKRFNIHKRMSNYDLARKTPKAEGSSEINFLQGAEPNTSTATPGVMGFIKNIFKRGSQRGS